MFIVLAWGFLGFTALFMLWLLMLAWENHKSPNDR